MCCVTNYGRRQDHVQKKESTLNPGCQPKFTVRPASPDEAGLFYASTPERDAELGCIGHVRIDFGQNGREFFHTWWKRGDEGLNSPEFKAELGQVVDELRESVLSGMDGLRRYCREHGGSIEGGYVQNYGYVVETERYRYCLRCNPVQGDYNAYLTCFDKRVQEMNRGQKQSRFGLTDKRISSSRTLPTKSSARKRMCFTGTSTAKMR